MREFLEFVVRQLVEFPDEAIITEIPSGRTTVFRLQLRQSDVGRIIGRSLAGEDHPNAHSESLGSREFYGSSHQ